MAAFRLMMSPAINPFTHRYFGRFPPIRGPHYMGLYEETAYKTMCNHDDHIIKVYKSHDLGIFLPLFHCSLPKWGENPLFLSYSALSQAERLRGQRDVNLTEVAQQAEKARWRIPVFWAEGDIDWGTLWWTNIAIENGHRNSGCSHEKWWFSIAMLVYQRVE